MKTVNDDQVGDFCFFTDADGVRHDALITHIHSATCVNLSYVAGGQNVERNSFGAPIIQVSSVPHENLTESKGFFFS